MGEPGPDISPIAQELADSDVLSVPARTALDEIFNGTALGERVVSYKIWKQDGLVVEATDTALRGQRLEPSADYHSAWSGRIAATAMATP